MELEYGVNASGELVHIEKSIRGRTELKCPYCGVGLIARQGKVLAWHFAHDGPTCLWASSSGATLPLYDQFGVQLPGKVYDDLMKFAGDGPDRQRVNFNKMASYDLVFWHDYRKFWELTMLGRIVSGKSTLKPFLDYQEPLLMSQHEELVRDIHNAKNLDQLQQREMNLKIYRLQWQRVLQCALYFVQVDHAGGTLYKVGVTRRDIKERLGEIQADLKPHLGDVTLTVLDTWPHRGSVEFYFKYRYRQQQHRMGALTEYFKFDDVKRVLSYDLRHMPRRELTAFERDVLAGRPAPHEQERIAAAIEKKRRQSIRAGMARRAEQGEAIGRPTGQEEEAAFLAKPTSQNIIRALNEGLSIRQAAAAASASTTTVQKVQRLIARASLPIRPGVTDPDADAAEINEA